MRIRLKRIKEAIGILIFQFVICSCASLGSKTIYNSLDQGSKTRINKVYVIKPTLINIDFYKESSADFYFDELKKILGQYNIAVIKSDTTISNFDNIKSDTELKISKASDCDFILVGRVTRLTALGQTRDFNVEYKLVKVTDNNLKYYSKYSTTYGKTYVVVPGVGLPTEEQLMRDAIKLGIHNIERDIFKK
jgi:hypothetical protein